MVKKEILELNLLENAFDYLNSALEYVKKARQEQSQRAWKFAILNICHCIELLMKERLRQEHELLLYAQIDKYRPITRTTSTVSWAVAIERLRYILGEDFKGIDAGRLDLAQSLRNQMVHYDVMLEFPQVYHHFANLANFAVRFYDETLKDLTGRDLFSVLDRQLWKEEEDLDSVFSHEMVYFNGIFMRQVLRDAIIEEQKRPILIIDGIEYERIRRGSETWWQDDEHLHRPCHDCSVVTGQIHLYECDMEQCPKCKEQLFSCDCTPVYIYEE